MDVYRPCAALRGWVFFVHGGAWTSDGWREHAELAAAMARRGLGCVVRTTGCCPRTARRRTAAPDAPARRVAGAGVLCARGVCGPRRPLGGRVRGGTSAPRRGARGTRRLTAGGARAHHVPRWLLRPEALRRGLPDLPRMVPALRLSCRAGRRVFGRGGVC